MTGLSKKNVEEATECMEPFFPLKECMEENGMLLEAPENTDDSVELKDDVKQWLLGLEKAVCEDLGRKGTREDNVLYLK